MASSKKRKPQRRRAHSVEIAAGLTQNPLQAYRDDLGTGAPAPADGALVSIAVLLKQAVDARSATARERLRRRAVTSAREVLGPEGLRNGCVLDDHPARTWFDIVRTLAEYAEARARLRLALNILQSAQVIAETREARMALELTIIKVRRRMGEYDVAQALAKRLERDARKAGDIERATEAMVSQVTSIVMRGSTHEVVKFRKRLIAEVSRLKRPTLLAEAWSLHSIPLHYSGEQEEAIQADWYAYSLAAHPVAKASGGSNLGHALHDAGYFREARIVFESVLRDPLHVRIVLAVLAGIAISSAALGDRRRVRWAVAQVKNVPGRSNFPRESTIAASAAGEALTTIGETDAAKPWREEAAALIKRYAFHDLMFRDELVEIQRKAREKRAGRKEVNNVVERIWELDDTPSRVVEVIA
jgi:hypothetical protein